MSRIHPAQAFKLALRGISRDPGTAVAGALTLAAGFGALAAIYSVLTGFDRPLPVPEGERVMQVRVSNPAGAGAAILPSDLEGWRTPPSSLSALGAFATDGWAIGVPGRPPERMTAAWMTPEVWRVLRVDPVAGRVPQAGSGGGGDIVLSHEVALRWFGDPAQALGQTLRVNGEMVSVLAVMPPGFAFPYRQAAWRVWDPRAEATGDGLTAELPSGSEIEVVARLADGASAKGAEAALTVLLRAARAEIGATAADPTVRVIGYTRERGEGGERIALLALLLIVLALLLVSCTNVSNLLLVRGVRRARLMAVHSALGADPAQVMAQMFMEAALIAIAGATLGFIVAIGAVEFIEATLSRLWGYYWMKVEIRPGVLGVLGGVALLTTVVAGTLPAFRAGRADLTAPLRSESAGSGARGLGWGSWTFLTGQVAFSVVAVLASGLMAWGLLRTQQVSREFPADQIQALQVVLDGDQYGDAAARAAFRSSLVQQLQAHAAIDAAALSTGLPGLRAVIGRIQVEGAGTGEGQRPVTVGTQAITPAFLEVFGMEVVRGRGLRPEDGLDPEAASSPVVLVTEAFVAEHLVGEPIGQRVQVSSVGEEDAWSTIVGVVSNLPIYEGEDRQYQDWVLAPVSAADPGAYFLTLRSTGSGGGAAALEAAETALQALDPDLPVSRVLGNETASMTEVLAIARRFFEISGLLALLGGVAAVLVSAIGLYGVLAFEVMRRKREMGVRLALGAGTSRVIGGVLKTGLVRVAPGLALGLLLAWAAMPVFGIFLQGISPRHPGPYVAVALGYGVVALLATVLPARRASAYDPAEVLRAD